MLAISQNHSNNTNFTSKLRLSPKNVQRQLWQDVAKNFEKSTKKSNYEFYLEHDGKTIKIDASAPSKTGGEHGHGILLNEAATAHLMRYEKADIVKQLIRLQDIYKFADSTIEAGVKFLNSLQKNDKYSTLHKNSSKFVTHYDDISGAIYRKYKSDVLAGLKNDAILYDSDVLY